MLCVAAMLKLVYAALCTLFLFSCTTAGPVDREPPVQISGMLIENQTQMYVSAVRLLVPVTGSFVSCGSILPESMCSTTFPETAYTGNPVEITWSQGGQIHSTGPFALALPADLDAYRPVIVHVVISGPGSAGAVIIQNRE